LHTKAEKLPLFSQTTSLNSDLVRPSVTTITRANWLKASDLFKFNFFCIMYIFINNNKLTAGQENHN